MAAQRLELTIPSNPMFLQLVRGMMEKVGNILDLPLDMAQSIILAVDEASSNIIKYAYLNDPSGRIEFSIQIQKQQLDISIIDYGQVCDINKLKPRDPEEVRPGGLGTYIINQVMDEVTYTCGEKWENHTRNRILMTKFLDLKT